MNVQLAISTLALMLTSAVASAQPSVVAQRYEAQALEENHDFEGCAKAYMHIFEEQPDAQNLDDVLYNAGVCYEDAKLTGLAMATYALLEQRFPRSVRAQKALVRRGSLAAAITDYEQAAAAYEEYAIRYGAENDASLALRNAITYRKALAQDRQAIANIEVFVRKYKRKHKRESAAALFSLAEIYEQQGNSRLAIRAYKRYIKEAGRGVGKDRLLIANAKIGELLWKQSCPTKTVDGSCLRATRVRSRTRRCGPDVAVRYQVVRRSPNLVKQARRYSEYAMRLGANADRIDEGDSGRKAAAIYWRAATQFYLQEARFEAYLTIEFPTSLDFSEHKPATSKRSKKRFDAWVRDTRRLSAELILGYQQVERSGGGAAWGIAASARVGQVSEHLATMLTTAEIPRDVWRTKEPFAKDAIDAFCHQLTATASQIQDNAVVAYGFCLELSTATNWFDGYSRLCERKLGVLRPADFPPPSEQHGESNGVGMILDSAPLMLQR